MIALKFSVVKLLQPKNAEFPIEVTLFGMVTEVKPLQPSNALLPMEVTLLGMVIEVKPLQFLTKYAGMRCTLSPTFTVVSEVPQE